jgi:hypothetical protein
MAQMAPSFIKSKYFFIDENGWNLTADAPEKMKKEFEEFMRVEEQEHEGFMEY